MQQIALSIEQMKHLEELGLDITDAALMWSCTDPSCSQDNAFLEVVISNRIFDKYNYYIPAYTLQEVLEKLPDYIESDNIHYYYEQFINGYGYKSIRYGTENQNIQHSEGSNEHTSLLTAAYKMLCWCIKNNYIEV